MSSIEGLLKTQPGIVSVQISLLAERGIVEYDETIEDPAWTPEKIAEEIDDCGFEAQVVEKSLVADVQMSVFGLVPLRRNLPPPEKLIILRYASLTDSDLQMPIKQKRFQTFSSL